MPQTTLNDLLEAMPNIAKVVNTFTSDAVQQKAFTILIRALGADQDAIEVEISTPPREKRVIKHSDKEGKTRKTQTVPPRLKPDLNLRPTGKKSLREFIGEKRPLSNEERFAVIIFYLKNTLEEKSIDRNHIYTAFKELGIKFPLDIDAALRMAVSRKGWIDNSDAGDLKMTVHGENFVEHDLPRKDGSEG